MQIVCFVELSALNLENQLSALRFLAVFQNVCLFKADDDSMIFAISETCHHFPDVHPGFFLCLGHIEKEKQGGAHNREMTTKSTLEPELFCFFCSYLIF